MDIENLTPCSVTPFVQSLFPDWTKKKNYLRALCDSVVTPDPQ